MNKECVQVYGPFWHRPLGIAHIRTVKKKSSWCAHWHKNINQKRCRKPHNCLTNCLATWAVSCIIQVLLRVSGKAALKPVLPEFGEPRVPGVGSEPELQEVVIEGGDLFRLQLHSDATHSLLFISLHHLDSVCPAIAAERNTNSTSRNSPSLCPSCVIFAAVFLIKKKKAHSSQELTLVATRLLLCSHCVLKSSLRSVSSCTGFNLPWIGLQIKNI